MGIPVIDLFAGPGGLGEGFSALEASGGRRPFRIGLSVEKDAWAHQTLRLRSFFRQFPRGKAPELYYELLRGKFPLKEFPERLKAASAEWHGKWLAADREACRAELGASVEGDAAVSRRIGEVLEGAKDWVLIGGPPCQAYSLVGRSRNKGKVDYRIEDDPRSSLYRQYLRIIAEHWPAVFVMENVKGMLSARLDGQLVFDRILADLRQPLIAMGCADDGKPEHRYRIEPIVMPPDRLISDHRNPRDFIVESERYGVPQQRHRVILVGVREDTCDVELPPLVRPAASTPTVSDVIGNLPRLRSGVSRTAVKGKYVGVEDSNELWIETIRKQSKTTRGWRQSLSASGDTVLAEKIANVIDHYLVPERFNRGAEFISQTGRTLTASPLEKWLRDERLQGVCNHHSRRHLDSDLPRYLFAAAYGEIHHQSPRLEHFHHDLLPKHANAKSGHFNDRFRVQLANRPSTTITSHISRDGHYFIHYDPEQCRSLTVREAARLQTFPDNYFFCGPRTQQYVQVGNAVPPYLARQIASSVWQFFVKAGLRH